jgi:hypothetical protein
MRDWTTIIDERAGEGYMTAIVPADLFAALARAAGDVKAAARDAAELDASRIGDDGEWTPAEILGHVCDGARVWGGRMRRVVHEDEPELEAFDEELAIRVAGYRWKALEPLLAEFRIVSDDTLAFLRGLAASDWARVGRHPTRGHVTLGELARIELDHEQEHARQLRDAVERRRQR